MEDKFLLAAERAIYESITKQLASEYRGPVKDAVDSVLCRHQSKLETIIDGALTSLMDSASFKEQVSKALHDKVARTLVSRLGGEIESRVNELKSNPETRAKITLAITQLAKGD